MTPCPPRSGGTGPLELLRAATTRALAAALARLPSPPAAFGLHLPQVTDAGLKELAGLKSLQSLDLWGTQVTDAGLKELAGLQSLQTLYLAGTQVTDAGVAELQKALPGCQISQ